MLTPRLPLVLVTLLSLLAAACTSSMPDGAPASSTTSAPPQPNPDTSTPAPAASPLVDWPDDEEWFATGFLEFPLVWNDDESFDAGFSMYVAAWPLQETYPGPDYQTGLPSTWLVAMGEDDPGYSTIEGGLGWWNDTRFATETPKFIMGGVSRDFDQWANGPGAGAGTADVDRRDWDVPQGKYGVAQLSPYVLWAPDGLNLAEDTNGGLFGYGYQPLPLIEAREGVGDRSWTLFLETANFSGPISFFLPDFFAAPGLEDPDVVGSFFDARPMDPHRAVAMETQVIPAAMATDADGTTWARITTTQFPANTDDGSVLLDRISAYGPEVVWEPTNAWFDGGEPATAEPNADRTAVSEFEDISGGDSSTWILIFEGIDEREEYPIDWGALAEVDVSDPHTFVYRWNPEHVRREGDRFVLPDYYRLEEVAGELRWRPVPAEDVPTSTGLHDHEFAELGVRNDGEPYTTPAVPGSPWTSPGPSSGPFTAELSDGSTVTYHWYRFVDQPAIRFRDFTEEQLDEIQSRVEAIHEAWGPDREYLAPPSTGELAALDPAILVEPPPGMEVGYVPIVTRQELTAR